MPNTSVPGAAEGVPATNTNAVASSALIEVIDQLGRVRALINLVEYAMDPLASDSEDRQLVNAMQYGLMPGISLNLPNVAQRLKTVRAPGNKSLLSA